MFVVCCVVFCFVRCRFCHHSGRCFYFILPNISIGFFVFNQVQDRSNCGFVSIVRCRKCVFTCQSGSSLLNHHHKRLINNERTKKWGKRKTFLQKYCEINSRKSGTNERSQLNEFDLTGWLAGCTRKLQPQYHCALFRFEMSVRISPCACTLNKHITGWYLHTTRIHTS